MVTGFFPLRHHKYCRRVHTHSCESTNSFSQHCFRVASRLHRPLPLHHLNKAICCQSSSYAPCIVDLTQAAVSLACRISAQSQVGTAVRRTPCLSSGISTTCAKAPDISGKPIPNRCCCIHAGARETFPARTSNEPPTPMMKGTSRLFRHEESNLSFRGVGIPMNRQSAPDALI